MERRRGILVACVGAVAALLLVAAGAAVEPEPSAGQGVMTFRSHVIEPALSLGMDLYEPAITVSPTGTLYVAGHTPAVFTTRAPSFASRDDGRTWSALPGALGRPDLVPGDGRMNGGEGIFAADGEGRAWLFDNGAANVALTTWCDEGREECGYEAFAWDRPSTVHPCGPDGGDDFTVPDRPWVAHAGGKLLLVVSAGPIQIGLHDVDAGLTRFNLCATRGLTPGPGAIRAEDGLFAVPVHAARDGPLKVVTGTSLDDLRETEVFPRIAPLGCASVNWGFATFSAAGTLYVATVVDPKTVAIATSRDGVTFTTSLHEGPPGLAHLWITGNPKGEGALLTYATASRPRCDRDTDFHAAHVRLLDDGAVAVENRSLVAEDVPRPEGHYVKSDVGPDGRAYLVLYSAQRTTPLVAMADTTGERPLRVYVQTGGPTL